MTTYTGDETSEVFFDTADQDVFYAWGGDDHITVTSGNDLVYGGEGEDTLKVLWGYVSETVRTANLSSLSGGVTLSNPMVIQRIDFSSIEHMDITSGSGDDEFRGTSGRWDRFDGNAGVDTWSDNFGAVLESISIDMKKVSSSTGQTLSDGTFLRNIEIAHTVWLTQGNDSFCDFGDYDDFIGGNEGDDFMRSSGGKDIFAGMWGDDTLVIDWGDATVGAYVENNLHAWAWLKDAADIYTASRSVDFDIIENLKVFTGSGADELRGGDSVDIFYAGAGGDVLFGFAGDDKLVGGSGWDQLDGGAGDDTLNGGKGNDNLVGGAGGDLMDGQKGVDTVSYAASSDGVEVDLEIGSASGGDAEGDTLLGIENLTGSDSSDILTGSAESNKLMGGGDDDTLTGNAGSDVLRGGSGRDTLYGSGGTDTLKGDNGNDKLRGGTQDDLLLGGGGADRLFGQAGADVLDGGAGNDVLTGGKGDDFFVFNGGLDRIADFVDNREMIELAGTLLGIEGQTVERVLDMATVVDGDTVIDFGGGNVLVIDNWNDIDKLADDMSIL